MKDQTYARKIHGVYMTNHGKGYEGKYAGKDRMNGCMIFTGVMLTLIFGFVFFISIKLWFA